MNINRFIKRKHLRSKENNKEIFLNLTQTQPDLFAKALIITFQFNQFSL